MVTKKPRTVLAHTAQYGFTFSVREAASYLKIHPETLRKLARAKEVKGFQPLGEGGPWIFYQESLDIWIKGGTGHLVYDCPNAKKAGKFFPCKQCWKKEKA